MVNARQTSAELHVTAKDTADRLAKKAPLTFEPLSQPDEITPFVMVDSKKTFQTMEGIGGALTDSSAETYARMPVDVQKEILTAYFDDEKGIGYSFCRTNIHSCDFSSDLYTYDDVAGDTDLANFSIEHDRKFRLPFIKAAMATGKTPFTLFASPWSPPSWMKTNGEMLHGGRLKPEYRDAWASYYGRFVKAYEAEGVPIWGLSVQNEPMAIQPWQSCIFTGEEERDFVRDHLGPALERDGLSRLKLMIWDHNRGLLYARAKVVYDDPEASKYVWGTCFHWYVGDHFDQVRQTYEAWPDKKLVFSEGCPELYNAERVNEWLWGEKYGLAMLMDISNGTSAWTDWNVLLDEQGGPNHAGNFCYAPIHADRKTGKLTYMNSFYYIGHFSKFVRPGDKRVSAVTDDDRLLATAFVKPDGKVAVVVLNLSEDTVPFSFWIDGETAKSESPAHSIMTLVY
jgi:glucosylceramidase